MIKGCAYFYVLTVESQKIPCQVLKIFKKGVETMGDECNPVDWILSPIQAHSNYFKIFGHFYIFILFQE
jgi:hypothetical protein